MVRFGSKDELSDGKMGPTLIGRSENDLRFFVFGGFYPLLLPHFTLLVVMRVEKLTYLHFLDCQRKQYG